MDRLKKYMLPLLVLGFLASIALGFRTFFMSNIIEPIALLCWAAWRVISSVDQSIYWMILIVICSILVIRLVPAEKDSTPSPAYNYTYRSHNRVEYWKTIIQDAGLGKEEAEGLRDSLKKLLISAISQVERSDRIDLEDSVAAGNLPLSLAAYRYLFPPEGQGEIISISRLPDIMFPATRWLRRWVGNSAWQDIASIDEILKYMETEMEISHDR